MEVGRVFVILLLNILGSPVVYGWQYFTQFKDLVMIGTEPEKLYTHSEYFFGDCRREGIIDFKATVHLSTIDIQQKPIIRGWLKIHRIPTCIILRAFSSEDHMFRSTAYEFQMCVPRISYCHSQRMDKFYYYEWYIPEDYKGGMEWDIVFFGPPSLVWQ